MPLHESDNDSVVQHKDRERAGNTDLHHRAHVVRLTNGACVQAEKPGRLGADRAEPPKRKPPPLPQEQSMNAWQPETCDVRGVLRGEDTLHYGAVRQACGSFLAGGRTLDDKEQQY
jgi:hypothetical protein